MNKKFLSAILFGALAVASTGSFVSCKDYDDDINNLQTQIGQLANKQDLQSQVSTLQSAISTAQSAAENKAAAAQKTADEAKAAAEAAAKAAASATSEAEKAAAEAAEKAAAAKLAEAQAEIKAANDKIDALDAKLAELKTFAEGLASKEDFEAAKENLNKEFAALKEDIEKKMGTFGMTGLSIVNMPDEDTPVIKAAYGKWTGIHKGSETLTEWKGEATLPAVGDPVTMFGAPSLTIAVNPTNFDLSNTEFAVVNQYGDQAPIAFETPVAPTRALSAGVYELPYKVGKVEEIAAFHKAFNGTGSTATLVAAGSNIAAQVRPNFVKVDPANNSDKSLFETMVPYEEISSPVVLKAKNPELVYDAYIVMTDGYDRHDSMDIKLDYSGTNMTVIFDADKVKKLAAKNNLTIKFKVQQINLNGYIHEVSGNNAVLTFLKKLDAEPIVKEAATLEAVKHDIVVNVYDKTTGRDTDLQNKKVSLAKALKDWGLDDKDSDDYQHWMHKTATVTAEVVKSYYLGADEDAVEIEGLVTPALNAKKDELTLTFAKDYKYTGWNVIPEGATEPVDAAWNGKTIYNEIALTLTDNDLDEQRIYKVVVPVKFNKIDATKYYGWDAKFAQSIKKVVDGSVITAGINWAEGFTSKQAVNSSSTAADAPVAKLVLKAGKAYKADGTEATKASDTKVYVTPALTVTTDVTAVPDYKVALDAVKALVIDSNLGFTETLYTTEYTKASTEYKEAKKNSLIAQYMNYVSMSITAGTDTYTETFGVPANVADAKKTTDVWYYKKSGDQLNAVPVLGTTPSSKIVLSALNSVSASVKNSMLNRTYTISGFAVEIADREVASQVDIQLSSEAFTTSTMTVSYNKLVNKSTAPSINLYNATHRPLDATGYVGSYSITDNYGYACYIVGATCETASTLSSVTYTILKANGTIIEEAGKLEFSSATYAYAAATTTADKKSDTDLRINVANVPSTDIKAGDKVIVNVPNTIIKRYLDNKTIEENVTFVLEVVE